MKAVDPPSPPIPSHKSQSPPWDRDFEFSRESAALHPLSLGSAPYITLPAPRGHRLQHGPDTRYMPGALAIALAIAAPTPTPTPAAVHLSEAELARVSPAPVTDSEFPSVRKSDLRGRLPGGLRWWWRMCIRMLFLG
ncbi:hypothetical protein P175DRAFT_0502196 [Aspergillus ochraceoroseus IBT 24754]|uniref:Uncharacterized protein n=1 Tax=Aspergillus ochraceoroseus IBT 24754 TaxID=1392256 RepID=A0A2T5LUU2_9EURO|nr:uncharacterized protein P175DRAFT_0502196 [Aspergillus ochraceoroseus IBT 24754]PTU20047.1 hypothetical protein P175DRAFT_0502196 [Aspergillus ochraceoroseus IBT 24754]